MIQTRQTLTALLASLCLTLLLFAPCALQAKSSADSCLPKNLKKSATVAGYKFLSYRDKQNGLACLQVIHNGRVLFHRTNEMDGSFWLGQHPDKKRDWTVPDIPNGTDVTGLGYPDMIVPAYSGGAHCCLSVYLFQLQPKFHLVARLDTEDTWPAYFARSDHNGRYYFHAYDWTLAYWPSSFAGSPTAPIVLKFVKHGTSGSFHLALDKMRKPPPSPHQWHANLKTARSAFAQGAEGLNLQPALWYYVMQLIYSGHSNLAWKFLDEAWPANVPGKAEWTGDFCSLLKTSPYWPDLKVELKNAPPACANAKPAHD